jgi:HEAT repeat protein
LQLRPTGKAAEYSSVARATGTDVAAAVHVAFRDAWRIIEGSRKLDVQPDAALIASLADSDPRVRDFAIQRLGDRRSKDAVDPLCKLLATEERPELVLRVIGSLVSIGDERAVTPLIDLTYKKDPSFVLQVVFAVAAIGGRTAEAFLVTVASGHPHEAVQRGAEDALAELAKRRK